MPVVSATQEAEAGELLEPRRRKLQWAVTVPFHSSLGDRVRLHLKKKKKKKFIGTKRASEGFESGLHLKLPGAQGLALLDNFKGMISDKKKVLKEIFV